MVFTCGAWCLGRHDDSLWAWTADGFAWSMTDSSSGWFHVYNHSKALTQFSADSVVAVQPATHAGFSAARATLTGYPRVAALAVEGHGINCGEPSDKWQLRRRGDGTVAATCKDDGGHCMHLFAVDEPRLMHYRNGNLAEPASVHVLEARVRLPQPDCTVDRSCGSLCIPCARVVVSWLLLLSVRLPSVSSQASK